MTKFADDLRIKVEENKNRAFLCIALPCMVMAGLFFLTILIPTMYSVPTIILHVLLGLSTAILYSIFSSVIDEKLKPRHLLLVKVALWQGLVYIISLFWWSIGNKIGSGSIASISALFFLIASAGCGLILTGEKVKAAFEYLKDYDLLKGSSEDNVFTVGDVILCNVFEYLEAGKKDCREILFNKDRFLHMLILGATGTGKTSQVLIPMIHQDVQNKEAGVIVLEPKGDLAQKVKFMAKHYDREAFYFDPAMSDCPYFNPLSGREIDVIENMATTFRMLNPDSPTFFLDLSEQLVRNAVKVLKRMDRMDKSKKPDFYSTLNNLSTMLQNRALGSQMIDRFNDLCKKDGSMTPSEKKENEEICVYFQDDYYQEKSKTFENTSGVRSQVAKICSNEFLRDVLNPNPEELRPDGSGRYQCNDIDFDKALAEGHVLCLSTAQGTLRDLSRFLGLFIILQLQSAVFRRPGNEDTRRSNFLYIDEFQVFATPGFADMLTMGRSYRVASHLATQARAQMAMGGGKDGDNFVTLVSTNARNVILFPGCSYEDAKYYSDQFGEKEEVEVQVGITRKKFNIFTGGLEELGHPSESIRETKKMVPVFTPTDLIYREFGDIVYCIIKKNSIQTPKIGKISYIPQELNKKLDSEILAYLAEFTKKTEDEMREIREREAEEKVSALNDISFDDGESIGEDSIEDCPKPSAPIMPASEKLSNSSGTDDDIIFNMALEDDDDKEPEPANHAHQTDTIDKPHVIHTDKTSAQIEKETKEADVADCLGDLDKVMQALNISTDIEEELPEDFEINNQSNSKKLTEEDDDDDEELEEFDV